MRSHGVERAVDDAHVAGSPFMLECLPAPAVAATSSFDSTSVTVRAGEPVRLRLTARDAFGNECREGGGLVSMYDAEPSSEPDRQAPTPSAAALAAASATTPPPSPFYHERLLGPGDAISVVDEGDGRYSASLVLHRVGRRLIVGRIDGRAIDGPPVAVTVTPAALHAPSSIAHGDALECFVVAGVPARLRVSVRDRFGNVSVTETLCILSYRA